MYEKIVRSLGKLHFQLLQYLVMSSRAPCHKWIATYHNNFTGNAELSILPRFFHDSHGHSHNTHCQQLIVKTVDSEYAVIMTRNCVNDNNIRERTSCFVCVWSGCILLWWRLLEALPILKIETLRYKRYTNKKRKTNCTKFTQKGLLHFSSIYYSSRQNFSSVF